MPLEPSEAFGCSLCCVDSLLPIHPTSRSRAPPSFSINGLKRAFYSAHRPPDQYLHSQDAPRPAGLGCCCTAPCRQDGRLPMARAGRCRGFPFPSLGHACTHGSATRWASAGARGTPQCPPPERTHSDAPNGPRRPRPVPTPLGATTQRSRGGGAQVLLSARSWRRRRRQVQGP